MVTGQTNECSTASSPFHFKAFYDLKDQNTLCYDIADQLKSSASTINALGALLNKPSLKAKRGAPAIDIVGMLSWGMNSALKGCSPTKCPINTGMAAGLFSSTETSFPKSASCPVREDVVDGNNGQQTSASVIMSMILMGVVTMVHFF
tara:strand:+ start:54 stop:497 length:444 start_codon:yes stop_codon:yes gene_type:complete